MSEEEEYQALVLRDLPGVDAVEALLAAAELSPSGKWSREFEEAQKLAEKISKQQFGIAERDTRYVDDAWISTDLNDRRGGEWDSCFEDFEENNLPSPKVDWMEIGWDVTDGAGKPLRALELFWRQIVATEYGLCGHTPGFYGEELPPEEAAAIEQKLAAEAAKFRPKR